MQGTNYRERFFYYDAKASSSRQTDLRQQHKKELFCLLFQKERNRKYVVIVIILFPHKNGYEKQFLRSNKLERRSYRDTVIHNLPQGGVKHSLLLNLRS
jgi:hypothetical protein